MNGKTKRGLAIQRNHNLVKKKLKTLTLATTWMTLENIMLSEKARHRKPDIILFHSYKMSIMGLHRNIKKLKMFKN